MHKGDSAERFEIPLVGGAADFAAWGEPSRPGLPLGETGKGRIGNVDVETSSSVMCRLSSPLLQGAVNKSASLRSNQY